MGDLKFPWYSREYPEQNPPATPAQELPLFAKNKPPQTMPSVDNSARASSNVKFPMSGKLPPGGTPEWYGRATQQMPSSAFTPPPGVGQQPPRPDAPERRRWLS